MRASALSALTAILLAGASACDDDRPQQLPIAPDVASNAVAAYVAVSDANPMVGSQVSLWVRARRGSLMGPIGSFTVRLAYDSTRLRFQDAARSAEGMVLANGAAPGLLVAAGASAQGFQSDELLAARFDVIGAHALDGLQLSVTELNSVTFENQKASARVERGLFRDAAPKR